MEGKPPRCCFAIVTHGSMHARLDVAEEQGLTGFLSPSKTTEL